jgi:hypothetical protein
VIVIVFDKVLVLPLTKLVDEYGLKSGRNGEV